jgi:N-acyl-D-amino-acid deacylase
MGQENTDMVLTHPLVMLGSDGSALAPYGPLGKGIPHPRSYGSFPRFLKQYVREKKLLSLPAAVKKMTSMPADKMGLSKRGRLKTGCYADIVIFEPGLISDLATYIQPEKYPVGIEQVFVNGRLVIDRGHNTGRLPGKLLRFSQSPL